MCVLSINLTVFDDSGGYFSPLVESPILHSSDFFYFSGRLRIFITKMKWLRFGPIFFSYRCKKVFHILTIFTINSPYIYCIYYRPSPCPGMPRPGPHQAQPYVCRRHSLFFYFCSFFTFWAFSQRPSLRYGARARIWGQGQAQAYVCRRQFLFLYFCLFFLLLARE